MRRLLSGCIAFAVLFVLATSATAQTAPNWAPGTSYAVGANVSYQGLGYRCVQAHTSRVGWEPPNAPTLWQRLADPSAEWQPWTRYNLGALVMYQSATYRVRQSHTSQPGWEPPNVPALWQISAVDDAVLHWNAVAIDADARDHSGLFQAQDQGGPTRASRAQAIVHAAIFDAVNSVDRTRTPYLTLVAGAQDASLDAAVAVAAHRTLIALYPNQRSTFDTDLQNHLSLIPSGPAKTEGMQVGQIVAQNILTARSNDGANSPMPYTPSNLPGRHRPDPLLPNQGFLTPGWGRVRPFAVQSGTQFRAPAPPALTSPAYAAAFNDAKRLGGDGVNTPTQRTQEQTFIGLYWAYDGSRLLGTPPRLYNQIARTIARQRRNTVVQNARLFGLINLAMGDAGITCWESKYFHDFWRPILGIREADPGTGPTGLGDGNPATIADRFWRYLGAPASNSRLPNFTPPFPAYPSGHATFGAALFRTLSRFYGTDSVPFTFVSDELNGITTDNRGNVRPRVPRSFSTFTQATAENGRSRIYLGIHWQFDADSGIAQGNAIADYTFNNVLR
jgi:hypothetical protein